MKPLNVLTIDIETYGTVDIKRVGAWQYLHHPDTELLCIGFKLNNEPTKIWWGPFTCQVIEQGYMFSKEEVPIFNCAVTKYELFEAIQKADVIVAHNVSFEYNAWHLFPEGTPQRPPLKKWVDTAVLAAVHGLPRALDGAAKTLMTGKEKDTENKMGLYKCSSPDRKDVRSTNPEDYIRMLIYNKADVEAEYALLVSFPDWRKTWKTLWREWVLDQEINHHGIPVDFPYVYRFLQILKTKEAVLLKRMASLVNNAFRPTQVAEMLKWLKVHGLKLPDLRAKTVKDALKRPDLPPIVREVLEIRAVLGRSSTKKFQAFLDKTDPKDARLRDSLVFWGSNTGRWASMGVQVQNMARSPWKPSKLFRLVSMLFKDPSRFSPQAAFQIGSAAVRGSIFSPFGIMAGDFDQIESRVLAWVAGEDSILDAYRKKEDVYKRAASAIFDIPVDQISKESYERLIGKVATLALGYQGGPTAFRKMGPNYGLEPMEEEKAKEIVQKWRARHPKIVDFWAKMEMAAREAILTGKKTKVDSQVPIFFDVLHQDPNRWWLRLHLPSGRMIHYFRPVIKKEGNWAQIHYFGINTYTRQWGDVTTYGGKLTENLVQGIARDFLVNSLLEVARAGFTIIFHVHDEIVVETESEPTDEKFKTFLEIAGRKPEWAGDFPLAISGWYGKRYRKD